MSAQHTTDHVNCPACRSRSIAGQRALQPEMPFEDAFSVWMKQRTGISDRSKGRVRKWKPRTIETYQDYGDAFAAKFGRVPLREISDGHLQEYAEERAEAGCGTNLIRKETDTVVRILREAKLWTKDLDDAYKLLRPAFEVSDDQRRLSDAELLRLMADLRQRPESARWVLYDSVIALHTCTSTNERRFAKIKDVMLEQRIFRVGPEQSKNKYRNRRVPLETDEVIFAFEQGESVCASTHSDVEARRGGHADRCHPRVRRPGERAHAPALHNGQHASEAVGAAGCVERSASARGADWTDAAATEERSDGRAGGGIKEPRSSQVVASCAKICIDFVEPRTRESPVHYPITRIRRDSGFGEFVAR